MEKPAGVNRRAVTSVNRATSRGSDACRIPTIRCQFQLALHLHGGNDLAGIYERAVAPASVVDGTAQSMLKKHGGARPGSGRPATGSHPIRAVRLSDNFVKGLDEWRAKQDDAPNRSEAIRRLVELGLKAKGK